MLYLSDTYHHNAWIKSVILIWSTMLWTGLFTTQCIWQICSSSKVFPLIFQLSTRRRHMVQYWALSIYLFFTLFYTVNYLKRNLSNAVVIQWSIVLAYTDSVELKLVLNVCFKFKGCTSSNPILAKVYPVCELVKKLLKQSPTLITLSLYWMTVC